MKHLRLFSITFFTVILFVSTQQVHAQDLLKGKDLSQIKVEQLSDADLAKLKAQINSSGLTMAQVEQTAISKGMPQAEFDKLKARLTENNNTNTDGKSTLVGKLKSAEKLPEGRENNSGDTLDTDKSQAKLRPLINPLIFGSELFTTATSNFEPNLKLATPMNYVLGPTDQLTVSIYGVQQYNGDLVVSPEGAISVPSVGEIQVAGLTIEAATQKLKTILGNGAYPYLKNGGSKLSITLSKIRSIKVTIIGAKNPGNPTLSSLATVFQALFVSGGPSEFGSFRQIELIRNGKLFKTIDLYRFILNGDQSDNIGLKDNDVIRIPTYKNRVELQGQIKRPGIFEVLPGETFNTILSFASGFTDTAYRASVKVYQRDERERKVHDLKSNDFPLYLPQSGDLFVASKILNRYQNRVTITGAIFRPDVYELYPGLKVADLIRNADGLKEDAFTERGQIVRLQEDLTKSILSFNVSKALANSPVDNIELKREDEVMIASILELKDSFKVDIQGEVRIPGKYEYVEKLTLKDLILQAGGFTDAAYKQIEIARLTKRDSIIATDRRASTIIKTEISGDLSELKSNNIVLKPFDVITVRRKAGYTLPESVMVTGQVQYPGPYALESLNETVSSILSRAGGFTPDAYPEGAYLKRFNNEADKQRAADVAKKVAKNIQTKDSVNVASINEDIKREFDQIPLDLVEIGRRPGSEVDLVLKAKDELFIPKFNGQVKISGAVLIATQVPYRSNYSFKDYVNDAGGFATEAARRKAIVVYANGKAAPIKHFLFFRRYPKVLPGSEIVVNKRVAKKPISAVEFIGVVSALASMAGIAVAILSR